MVQCLLTSKPTVRLNVSRLIIVFLLLLSCASASKQPKAANSPTAPPDLLLKDGRKLIWERSFSSDRDIRNKPGFFTRMVNVIAGPPDPHPMIRPYSIAVDSHGRAIVTDPGSAGIHIFDLQQHKYKFVQRREKGK